MNLPFGEFVKIDEKRFLVCFILSAFALFVFDENFSKNIFSQIEIGAFLFCLFWLILSFSATINNKVEDKRLKKRINSFFDNPTVAFIKLFQDPYEIHKWTVDSTAVTFTLDDRIKSVLDFLETPSNVGIGRKVQDVTIESGEIISFIMQLATIEIRTAIDEYLNQNNQNKFVTSVKEYFDNYPPKAGQLLTNKNELFETLKQLVVDKNSRELLIKIAKKLRKVNAN